MSVSEKMIAKFNAPRITLRGCKHLWGRSFRRTYNLRDEVDAAKAEEAYGRLSLEAADWKRGREIVFGENPDGYVTVASWYCENVRVFDCAANDPCTFLKVTRHRK